MMKKIIIASLLILINLTLLSKELDKNEAASKKLGYMIGKNIRSNGFHFDIDAFVEGLSDKSELDNSSEEEYLHLINVLQNFISIEKKDINLKIANHFLNKNKNQPNIVEIIPGKIQYKITREGKGKTVTEDNNPLVKYKATTLDGREIYKTTEEQIVSLFDIISGLSKGLLGMKEGEVRIIYIHPDYSSLQGTDFEASLLKFEVELIKRHQNYEIDKSFISNQEHVR